MLFAKTSLKVGDPAPDFTLKDQKGQSVTLSKLKGRRVVLYFYPKASTPGCTAEACALRDESPKFPSDVTILGVSKDTVSSQKTFSDAHRLGFPLLADEKGEVTRLYGVDFLFGYAKRMTFLIGSDGKIAKIYETVNPKAHALEVLEALPAIA